MIIRILIINNNIKQSDNDNDENINQNFSNSRSAKHNSYNKMITGTKMLIN